MSRYGPGVGGSDSSPAASKSRFHSSSLKTKAFHNHRSTLKRRQTFIQMSVVSCEIMNCPDTAHHIFVVPTGVGCIAWRCPTL